MNTETIDGLPVTYVKYSWGGRRPGAGAKKGVKHASGGGAYKGNRNGCIYGDKTMTKQTQFVVPEQMLLLLNLASKKLKVSNAAFIRAAIKKHVEKAFAENKHPLLKQRYRSAYRKDSPKMTKINFKILDEDFKLIAEAARMVCLSSAAFLRKSVLLEIIQEIGIEQVPNELFYILQ